MQPCCWCSLAVFTNCTRQRVASVRSFASHKIDTVTKCATLKWHLFFIVEEFRRAKYICSSASHCSSLNMERMPLERSFSGICENVREKKWLRKRCIKKVKMKMQHLECTQVFHAVLRFNFILVLERVQKFIIIFFKCLQTLAFSLFKENGYCCLAWPMQWKRIKIGGRGEEEQRSKAISGENYGSERMGRVTRRCERNRNAPNEKW